MARERIYTKTGDDGTTGLFYGGRVRKDSELPRASGAVDEAQAVMGLARAEAGSGTELDGLLVQLERDLYVLMAELATAPENRHKLAPGASSGDRRGHRALRAADRVGRAGRDARRRVDDLARTVVRRAERHALTAAPSPSSVGPYLNRLSDLLWTLARWQEGESRPARDR